MFRVILFLLLTGAVRCLNWERIKYVYAFGDSYSYVEGTYGRPKFSFIGDMLNISFTPQQLFSNEILPNRTSSDGSIWLQFLTGCFSGRPSHCKRQLWDFAFAGADIDRRLLPGHQDFSVQMVDQVDQFITYALPYLNKAKPRETLVAWWIGTNDMNDADNKKTGPDWDKFWDAEAESYFRTVDKLDAKLKDACHLFLLVPPAERCPYALGNTTRQEMFKERIAEINSRVVKRVKRMRPCAILFDTGKWFNAVLDHPERYGFTNVTGTGFSEDGYFWFDPTHPSERAHRLLAEAVKKQL